MSKIMFVDDEIAMLNLIERIVVNNGYEFCSAQDGLEAIEIFKREKPDLLILDVMLPSLDGFQVCRKLRAENAIIPIIFLTAKGDISDKGAGFTAGGDDYLVKPFSPEELTLRLEAHLKRQERTLPEEQANSIVVGDLTLDLLQHKVFVKEKQIDLTPKEFNILLLLASHPNEVFTHAQITDVIWGENYDGEISSLPVFIRRIREKIEESPSRPQYIQTVWRIGYRLHA